MLPELVLILGTMPACRRMFRAIRPDTLRALLMRKGTSARGRMSFVSMRDAFTWTIRPPKRS